jgi:hypothetical protein
MVESQPSKLLVASSILVSRSSFQQLTGHQVQPVTPFTPFLFLLSQRRLTRLDHVGLELGNRPDFLVKIADSRSVIAERDQISRTYFQLRNTSIYRVLVQLLFDHMCNSRSIASSALYALMGATLIALIPIASPLYRCGGS